MQLLPRLSRHATVLAKRGAYAVQHCDTGNLNCASIYIGLHTKTKDARVKNKTQDCQEDLVQIAHVHRSCQETPL